MEEIQNHQVKAMMTKTKISKIIKNIWLLHWLLHVSLLFQYQERGGLSKKQLEGLLQKAKKITTLPPARLATLEAIIKKKVTRQRSELPKPTPLFVIDEHAIQMTAEILSKYPQHKRVLFYKTRLDNKETLSPLEKSELEKFHKLLVKWSPWYRYKKKGPVWKYSPFLNPISYEKPTIKRKCQTFIV